MEKVNIVKVGSDSINQRNIKGIIGDALNWEEEKWEKFLFVSSGAVKMWKQRVKSIWEDENLFKKSVLASIGQQFLMEMYDRTSWTKKLVWEILIDDFADEEYLASSLINMIENNVWPIINYNDSLHGNELLNVSNKTDNDKNTVFISQLIQTYLSTKIQVEKVIYLTNTPWLLNKSGETVDWGTIEYPNEKDYYRGFVEKDFQSIAGTGWMESKVNCSFEVLDYGAKQAIIANASHGLKCLKEEGDFTSFSY